MANYFFKQLITIVILTAPSINALAAINIAAYPSSQTIVEGGIAIVDIRIDGLEAGKTPSIATYDFDISFDPYVLSFISVAFGDSILGNQLDLFHLGNVASVTPSLGAINLFELSLDTSEDLNNLQAGSFALMTLRFSGFSVGISPINISVNVLGDSDGTPLLSDISSGSVVVTSIPEPASYLLMLLGIGLISIKIKNSHIAKN